MVITTNSVEYEFVSALEHVLAYGEDITTRNSEVRRTVNEHLYFSKTPLISVRKTAWKSALREMEWFLSGSSNINDLHPSVHSWWKPWADKNGEIPNNYSKQFRYYSDHLFNQIDYAIQTLKNHPYSRRNVITTWNTEEMVRPNTPITNCHGTIIQLFKGTDNRITMMMYQRSSDMVVGLQHNLLQYWALLMFIAHRAGHDLNNLRLHWIGGDCHIYKSHIPLVKKIIRSNYNDVNTPKLIYTPTSEEFKASDFSLDRKYEPIITDKAELII